MKTKTKKQMQIELINDKIDKMIIDGKTKTAHFKKLMRIHKVLVRG